MKLWAPNTVVRVAIENVGFRQSYTAVTFLIEWSIAMRKLGDGMKVEDFAEWWAVSRSQAFRRQVVYRRAFPGWDSPTDLVKALGLNVKDTEEGFRLLLDRPMVSA